MSWIWVCNSGYDPTGSLNIHLMENRQRRKLKMWVFYITISYFLTFDQAWAEVYVFSKTQISKVRFFLFYEQWLIIFFS